ncbi:MAG: methyltransferase domain-containing protein [Verrucomicrobiales bacterium]|nr:methyltransferase domain-containing protein [Verrucomicrobiales bacterium]MCP5560009.1 methyltransferase domain-containing protein [Verrucomicrobiaceae bacterium]
MGNLRSHIDGDLAEWIGAQRMFFVATAPLSADAHVNCSPKGGDAFRVLGELEVAYQDVHGSGAETVAHLRENCRILIMFCAFEGGPKIVRLHGRGEVIVPGHPRFESLATLFPPHPGTRSIIRIDVERVSDSCGFGVPKMSFVEDRDTLQKWAQGQGDSGLAAYRQKKNAKSIDGLPAFPLPMSPLALPATWDRVSEGYDAEVRPVFAAFSESALNLANVGAGMKVLDVAAGPGTLVELAAERGAQVNAIDFSPRMIQRLRERIRAAEWPGVEALVADGMALPFDAAAFDAVFSMFGLMFFSDRHKGLSELRRVLRPGCKAVISSWVPMSQLPLFATTMTLLGEILPDLLPSKPLPPVLNDATSCRREFEEAGFQNVQTAEQSVTFDAATMDDFVDSLRRTNAMVAHVAEVAADRWIDAERQLGEGLIRQFGAGPQSMTMTAILTVGTAP